MSLSKLAVHACVVLAIGIGAIPPTTVIGDSQACCTPNQGDQSTDPVCDMKDADLCVDPGVPQGAGTNCVDDPQDSDTVAEVCESMCGNSGCSVAVVDFVSGNSATIDRGSGPIPLSVGYTINIGDVVYNNADRVQYSYGGMYSGFVRSGVGAVAEFKVPPPPLTLLMPGLEWGADYTDGEGYAKGSGPHFKYRTTCWTRSPGPPGNSEVLCQPGSNANQDIYFALVDPLEVWEYQPTSSSDPEDFVLLLSLDQGQTATLTFDPQTETHTPGTPENIDPADLEYIASHYQDDSPWTRPVPTVSEWGLIVMLLLSLTAGTIVFARRRRPAVA